MDIKVFTSALRPESNLLRSPSKFPEIGYSQLVQKPETRSVVNKLFERQLGFPKFLYHDDGWFEKQVNRLLIKSRAPGDDQPVENNPMGINLLGGQGRLPKNKDNNLSKKWTRVPLLSEGSSSSSNNNGKGVLKFIGDYILISEIIQNIATTKFLTLNPWIGNSFELLYTLYDKPKIQGVRGGFRKADKEVFDWWLIGNKVITEEHDGVCKVPAIPTTLFKLYKQKLTLYDMNKGTKIDELDISNITRGETTKYTGLEVYDELSRIFLIPSKSSLKDFEFEFLVLSYPPLSVMYRIQICKGVLGKGINSFENIESLFCMMKSNYSNVSSVEELIKENQEFAIQCDHKDPILARMKTITVKNLPPILCKIKAINSTFGFICSLSPPHIYSKVKNGFEIYSLDNLDSSIYSIPKEDLLQDLSLHCYNWMTSDILVSGLLHGFTILKATKVFDKNTKKSSIVFREVFTTKIEQEDTVNNINNASQESRRSGMRQRKMISYIDNEGRGLKYYFAYEFLMDLFAVVAISDQEQTLQISIYEGYTKKLYKRLQPVSLKYRRYKECEISYTGVVVNFTGCYIAVGLKIQSERLNILTSHLYCVNLLAEEMFVL